MEGTQQDETDTNSHGSSGNESNGNESRQSRSSHSSTSGNGKDSAMLEATESSKSTNSHSPSPPSSSIAYSLLSASSEQDNPSTSGCSSEQSAREKNQKELMKALKELKIRLPSEKRGKGKSGTLATLQYALSCVKQVRANQEYYQQWTIDESQPCSLDMSSFTIEEVESVTSEYTLKNPDTFSVAVSFITGRIVYISDQASHILHCKRDVFKGAIFAEFLAPQDVSVFYGSTAPYHLPSWSSCTSGDTASMDYTQEKSVFCRIRWVSYNWGKVVNTSANLFIIILYREERRPAPFIPNDTKNTDLHKPLVYKDSVDGLIIPSTPSEIKNIDVYHYIQRESIEGAYE